MDHAQQLLNLFPSTSTPQQSQAKLQKLVYSATYRQPTPIQTMLAASLYDDGVQYMSTLEMNRAASFTYGYSVSTSTPYNNNNVNLLGEIPPASPVVVTRGESIAGEMWQLLVDLTLLKYVQHSVLALTKTIHLIQHVLLHGAEACIMNGDLLHRIEMAVEPLRNLNTALIEQKMVEEILNSEGRARGENDIVVTTEGIGQQLAQLGTRATATLLKLRGGSVDKGHPVRMAATKLHSIVFNPNNLRQMRMQQQQQQQQQQSLQDSLVPIGSAKQVGYITDEGRYKVLQAKMDAEERQLKQSQLQEQQRFRQTRSNLAGSSATDSFGGGYSSNTGSMNGKLVVGAAHSLQDMIESAKYELEQHKVKQQQKIASLKKGYSDDPIARAQQLAQLEQKTNVESDPEYIKKKKALEDALEYLEEMQRVEQEKVAVEDLLGGDSSGIDQCVSSNNGGAITNNICNDGVDLLGLDSHPTSQVDIFGAISSSFHVSDNITPVNVGGSVDLLGFDTMSGKSAVGTNERTFSTRYEPDCSISLSDSRVNSFNYATNDKMKGGGGEGGAFGEKYSVDTRPSLVTGVIGGSTKSPCDEEAEAEKTRKLNMAAGLFAGMVPTAGEFQVQQIKPMQSETISNAWAVGGLVPISAPNMSADSKIESVFTAHDLSTSTDPFSMGPMGGNCGAGIAPPPLMAPPPPPMQPPPPPLIQPPLPPPSMTMTTSPLQSDVNNSFSDNLTVEQMQEMIKQQQTQMNQMMQLMQQMQMKGSNNTSNI